MYITPLSNSKGTLKVLFLVVVGIVLGFFTFILALIITTASLLAGGTVLVAIAGLSVWSVLRSPWAKKYVGFYIFGFAGGFFVNLAIFIFYIIE
jgi:hypothetical protein